MSDAPVIFVCGRNAVRSPMAEALWATSHPDGPKSASFGLEPAALPDGFMITVMDEIGLDLSDFECRDMHSAGGEPFGHVICLADNIADAARAFAENHNAEFSCWPVADPTLVSGDRAMKLDAYRTARDEISAYIERHRSEIR
jgi:protein-tyrosine-phosphatase